MTYPNRPSFDDIRTEVLCLCAVILAVGFFELGEFVNLPLEIIDLGLLPGNLAFEEAISSYSTCSDRPQYPDRVDALLYSSTPVTSPFSYWSVEKNGKTISAGVCDGVNGKCRTTFRAGGHYEGGVE